MTTHQVGHSSTLVIDEKRDNRMLGVDVWYPALTKPEDAVTRYELLPGVSFPSATAYENAALASGKFPLLVWSHGRTGLRFNYSQLCEAIAAFGFVVASSDHPGDTLTDWMTGQNVDDETNDKQRLGDVSFIADCALGIRGELMTGLSNIIDENNLFIGGHSYGGLTALIATTGFHGMQADKRFKAAIGAQAYTRILPADLIASVPVPVLLLVGLGDTTTPPAVDAEPAWEILSKSSLPHRRLNLPYGGHQACSDFALYIELAPGVEGVPQLVLDYLKSIAVDSPAGFESSWRTTLSQQIEEIKVFLSAHV
jgi:alpha-beta hydrolase superfamily lysophospholipase